MVNRKSFLVIVVDPFNDLSDSNFANNWVLLPFSRNCDEAMEELHERWQEDRMCHVLPDYATMGQYEEMILISRYKKNSSRCICVLPGKTPPNEKQTLAPEYDTLVLLWLY